jgi:DNA-binding CsgD family transcriptional regulator
MLRDVFEARGLTRREVEVAELVRSGLSNREVANKLFVTEKTVKYHVTNIYKKIKVKSRSQLIVWCMPYLQMIEEETPQPEKSASHGPDWLPAGKPGRA